MKAYLIVTGTLFGLVAFLHLLRAISERSLLGTNPGEFVAMAALGALAAALSLWAWCLLRKPSRT